MNKRILLSVILLCCLVFGAAGQTRRQQLASHTDFIYVSVAAGAQGLPTDQSTLKMQAGSGLQLGFGYRMYQNHFLLQAGFEGKYGNYNVGAENDHRTLAMTDSENDPFTMNVYINDRRDVLHTAEVQIPVLVGGEWQHFYFLAGAKFDLNVYGSAVTSATLTATGTYDRFAEDFANMPNHQYYTDQPVTSARQAIAFNPQVMAVGEIGYRIGDVWTATGYDVPKSRTRYYIAAFAEYGFLNLHKAGSAAEPVTLEKNGDNVQVQVSPAFNASTYADAVVRNFMVGVRFTVAFELPKANSCVICHEQRIVSHNNFTW